MGFDDVLQKFFGDINQVKSLLQKTSAIIVAQLIVQERQEKLTIYIPQGISGFLWHGCLTKDGYLSANAVCVATV